MEGLPVCKKLSIGSVGMPIGMPARYDNIKRMAEVEKYHSEGLQGLFSRFDDHSEGLRGLFSKFDAHSEGLQGLFSKFDDHSEGLQGLFSKFDDHSEGLQGIFQLSETMPIQKR